MWGRPRVRLSGEIAKHLADVTIHVSLTHEADTAAAVAILEAPSPFASRRKLASNRSGL